MGREYAPLGPNSIFAQMEDSDYFGARSQEPQDFTRDRERPGDIPLIASRSREVRSPDESYDSARYQSLSPDTGDRRNSARSWSGQSASSIKRKAVHSTQSFQSLRKNITSSSFHKNVSDPTRPYARHYSFRRTRDKLFWKGTRQWLITVFFAGAVAGVLIYYEKMPAINQNQKHIFNSIITGLSICLGMNLASSLKQYAELVRWRLLTWSWLSVRQFDLVLQCGSMHKIVELFMASRKRTWPYMSWIQFLCLSWILFNIAAQIVVAMIGLTYSLDNSNVPILSPGNVSIADLSIIADAYDQTRGALGGQLSASHTYGIQGQDYDIYNSPDPYQESLDYSYQTMYQFESTPDNANEVLYRFQDLNQAVGTTDKVIGQPVGPVIAQSNSIRTVTTSATCFAYKANLTNAFLNGEQIDGCRAYFNNGVEDVSLYVPTFEYGATTWLSYFDYHCGPRCGQVWALQAELEPLIGESTVYWCNSTIGNVTNLTPDGKKFDLPDPQARYIAGAIGWTGYFTPYGNETNDFQFTLYSNDTYWSPDLQMEAGDAATLVSQFSAAALTAIDNNGVHRFIADGQQPQNALTVTVQWRFTIPLLVSIVAAQLIALIFVVLWANKAVIIDESFLSISKLLAPTVQKLGEHGSVLEGEEMAEAITDMMGGGDYKIFYGCREVRDDEDPNTEARNQVYGSTWTGPILRADLIDKGLGILPKKDRPFVDGTYD